MAQVVELRSGARTRPPTFVDATAMVAEDEPDRSWIIPGLIERQGRVLLVGAEKSGKSLLALTGAVQAAAGLKVWDRFETDIPPTVLYMDLEMTRSSIRRRLRGLTISAKLPDGALYLLHTAGAMDLKSARERRDLYAQLDEVQPDVLFIDPLYKFMLTDAVYEKDVRPYIDAMDELRDRYDCGIVLVHHYRKRAHGEGKRGKDASDVFGSSILLRWPEMVLGLEEDALRAIYDRDDNWNGIKSFPLKRGGQWPISLQDPELDRAGAIAQWLRVHGPASGNAVSAGVGGNRVAVLNTLSELEVRGAIRRNLGGEWEAAE